MNDTSGSSGHGQSLPRRVITPGMLAAYNMTRWRKAAGMTQEQLGKELGGWTKKAVSAAEKSWEGTRVRKFDADLIADLAAVFRIPIPAFFLPPGDDGETVTYVIEGSDGPVPMGEYFALLWPDPDWEADSPAAVAYQQAVISATAKYTDPEEATADLAAAVSGLAAAGQLEAVLRRARAVRGQLEDLSPLIGMLLEENAMLQDALERALAAKKEPS